MKETEVNNFLHRAWSQALQPDSSGLGRLVEQCLLRLAEFVILGTSKEAGNEAMTREKEDPSLL